MKKLNTMGMFLLVFALVLGAALGFAGCGNGTTSGTGGNNSGGSGTGGGPGTEYELSGTYMGENGNSSFVFNKPNVVMYGHEYAYGRWITIPMAEGTYVINGDVLTILCTKVYFQPSDLPNLKAGGEFLFTIADENTLLEQAANNFKYTKK